jgi:signal transduction histidine kinase
LPIRLRLTILAALGALLLSTVGGWVFLHHLRDGLHASADAALRTRADTLVQKVQDSGGNLDFQDPGATRLLDASELLAQVIAPDGHIVESSQGAGTGVVISPATLRTARTRVVFAEGHIPGDRHAVRFLASPVTRPDGHWVVVVGTSLASADEAVSRVRTGLLLGGALTVVVAAGGAWVLAGLALRPVERMRRQAAAISEHDAHTRLAVPDTRDEIAQLGRTMNELLERLQTALTQQRAFVADAGHEFRTPLAILRAELELAERPGRDLDELRRAVANAGEETDRLARLAEELLFLARHDEQSAQRARELQPLLPILARSAEGAQRRAQARGIEVVLDAPADLVAPVVGDDLRRAVDNLLDNAVRHSPSAARVELTGRSDNAGVVIVVRDHGAGFPTTFLPHAFERFRRADASRTNNEDEDGGAGLGLAIVRAVAQDHGGAAEARNAAGGGAEVVLRIPSG